MGTETARRTLNRQSKIFKLENLYEELLKFPAQSQVQSDPRCIVDELKLIRQPSYSNKNAFLEIFIKMK